MKCYVLIISDKFPKGHKNEGEPTWFPVKIFGKNKIHTIRSNYELWKERFEKIDKNEAYLSLRGWEGKPYRSKQYEIMKLYKSDGIGIQKINMHNFIILHNLVFNATEGYYASIPSQKLAKNDGLSLEDFTSWFKSSYCSKPFAIIHFTDFRYK